MPLLRLSHVNIRTTRLALMTEFYEQVLGLVSGARPPFSFAGAWLYCGDQPVVHLVGVEGEPDAQLNLKLQHFAFEASDLTEFIASLERAGVPYRKGQLAGWGNPQVHVSDPDGNRLHVDFPREDAAR